MVLLRTTFASSLMENQTGNKLGLTLVKEIDQDSVRFLAAGEKINDIETAIRELVENSIDAGATNIEVRLSKFGADAIEVEDNGVGIDEKNFPHLGSRYHTSKISDFKNLQESLETYGFRGEALSCLCNIANVVILTKTKTSPTGWKLTFKDGKMVKSERVGRSEGTTIIVKNLFHSMPVRRRELETNAKKQYDKIVRLLYEQILARPHIKFSLCKKMVARKEKDFTHGGTTLEGCLITMYSIKLLESLLPIRQAGLVEPPQISHNIPEIKGEDNGIDTTDNQLCSDIGTTESNERGDRFARTIINGFPARHSSYQQASSSKESGNRLQDETYDGIQDCPTQHSDLNHSLPAPSDFSQAIAPNREDIFYKRSRKSRFAREKPQYIIYGYISHIGKGRNSTDCQYIYVNKKPCDIPKLSRCINEIYRSYSQNNQYPFYCLFVQVQRWATDFNVPRKRGVILQDESKLCDIVRDSLEKMYSSFVPASQRSCPIAQIPMSSFSSNMGASQSDALNIACKREEEKQQVEPIENAIHAPEKRNETETEKERPMPSPKEAEPVPTMGPPQASPGPRVTQRDPPNLTSESASSSKSDSNLITLGSDVANPMPDLFVSAPKRARISESTKTRTSPRNQLDTNNSSTLPGFQTGLDLLVEEVTAETLHNGAIPPLSDSRLACERPMSSTPRRESAARSPPKKVFHAPEPSSRFEQLVMSQNHELKVKIEYAEDLLQSLERERIQQSIPVDNKAFTYAIHPKFNALAEDELKVHLNKTSFSEMQVIGQFNRGFIIGRLNKHLFIIDQHATDERANFEEQLEMSPLVRQAMIHPKPLYLSLIQENAIINNMEEFVKRGLEFRVDTSKIPGYRVMLSSTSICRGADRDEHLGKEDVEELVDVCVDSPNRLESYILSKVKKVSASIACRKSVMIGDKLTWQQMERIVARMSGLKNPWVCAHDRPTIRHLMDVDWSGLNANFIS